MEFIIANRKKNSTAATRNRLKMRLLGRAKAVKRRLLGRAKQPKQNTRDLISRIF